MDTDSFSVQARAFFERVKAKASFSIIIACFMLMCVGFFSSAVAMSQANKFMADSPSSTSNTEDSYNAMAVGYAFGSFTFICAFIMLFAAAIYISPACCGSVEEGKLVKASAGADSWRAIIISRGPVVGVLVIISGIIVLVVYFH